MTDVPGLPEDPFDDSCSLSGTCSLECDVSCFCLFFSFRNCQHYLTLFFQSWSCFWSTVNPPYFELPNRWTIVWIEETNHLSRTMMEIASVLNCSSRPWNEKSSFIFLMSKVRLDGAQNCWFIYLLQTPSCDHKRSRQKIEHKHMFTSGILTWGTNGQNTAIVFAIKKRKVKQADQNILQPRGLLVVESRVKLFLRGISRHFKSRRPAVSIKEWLIVEAQDGPQFYCHWLQVAFLSISSNFPSFNSTISTTVLPLSSQRPNSTEVEQNAAQTLTGGELKSSSGSCTRAYLQYRRKGASVFLQLVPNCHPITDVLLWSFGI